MARWVLIALLTGMVATCGQKGPLYLPDQQTAMTDFDKVIHAMSRE